MSGRGFARSIIKISGTIFMFVITIDMYIVLFHAMLWNHSVVVEFNQFGEAIIEYILFILMLPFIVASVIIRIGEWKNRRKNRRTARKGTSKDERDTKGN